MELTLDHEAPYFSNMRRRNSRKDSDLTGVVDLRYTGGARLLLMLELGAAESGWGDRGAWARGRFENKRAGLNIACRLPPSL